MTRAEAVMEGAAQWGAYYRKHPDKFAEDYLHIKLKVFQRIILVMMFSCTAFVMIAARGLGKSFISAVYCATRAVLYPGSKICVASGTRGQAINILEKITTELKPRSPELRSEIDEKNSQINGTNAIISFYNTSFIKVVTASDSSRGNRANVLLLDEFRLIPPDVIDTVLRKFLTQRRMPDYEELTDEQRQIEYDKEKNLTMWLSSAWFKDNWSYMKCVDTFKAMLQDTKKQFICAFPYQLSIKEGLLDKETVEDEMCETSFSDIKFKMEMCAEFYGSAEDAFFDFSDISKNRKIQYPILPTKLASKINSANFKIPQKQQNEVRILSADIALMSSKKNNNDATAIFINQMLPNKYNRYVSNIVYTEEHEGLRTDDQALVIRKLFDEFDCDYLVLDTNGKIMPVRMVTCGMKRGRNGNAEMPTRMEGCRYGIHMQRIGDEIIRPRVRVV